MEVTSGRGLLEHPESWKMLRISPGHFQAIWDAPSKASQFYNRTTGLGVELVTNEQRYLVMARSVIRKGWVTLDAYTSLLVGLLPAQPYSPVLQNQCQKVLVDLAEQNEPV